MKIENLLRFNGVRNELFYKPDICSTLGIYKGNVWGFRPAIYSSTMTQSSGKSNVCHHYWDLRTRSNWQQNQTEESPSKRLRRTSSISGTDGAMMNGGKGETEDSFRPAERPGRDRREPNREVWVGNLSSEVDKYNLYSFFTERYETVRYAKVWRL